MEKEDYQELKSTITPIKNVEVEKSEADIDKAFLDEFTALCKKHKRCFALQPPAIIKFDTYE